MPRTQTRTSTVPYSIAHTPLCNGHCHLGEGETSVTGHDRTFGRVALRSPALLIRWDLSLTQRIAKAGGLKVQSQSWHGVAKVLVRGRGISNTSSSRMHWRMDPTLPDGLVEWNRCFHFQVLNLYETCHLHLLRESFLVTQSLRQPLS